ncbi:hypothetical protein BRE01_54000 [Brevibacillus reuszeri]|uniref:Uncharacterized protein n=1 Tax=Brevibacillus reuszeri TaxID=54915 RepID=A0A0K9YKK0_9BACL|nr:Tm-1-like ATP-binding domain-containing protein [Brevibacillus reuszeri]KNB69177.1 hypothetical protein ADS79_24960 [Brevibacillus reuszeri]MED1860110.1 Tm-1-like ATP-binding domain-containing protein [Brevibacillus reuszeri]GED71698.1 hypothetical protein BRE01_54000 [Brevibacillus reuszeri]
MTKKVVLIGSLDTKGAEFRYVKEVVESLGVQTLVIDTGVLDEPVIAPDIARDVVALAGGMTIEELQAQRDRGTAVRIMTKGAEEVVRRLVEEGVVGAVFGMGGTAGTTVGAAAMRGVPIGIPKLLVSTVASGNTRPYVGEKDVMMMYSVVDIAGLNKLSSRILRNAAYAIAGMVDGMSQEKMQQEEKPMIAATMFGVTTPCVTKVREMLEQEGYDVLVFHATGTGGMAMEELVRAGFFVAVADITTTELADELVGGIFSAGPNRLQAAGLAGIPQVISVGALDMVNFGPPETVPAQFADRKFYQHNPTTTLMRTTVEENRELGKMLAERVNHCKSPTVLVFPKGGVSLLDKAAQAFDGQEERQALYDGIKQHLRKDILFIETDEDINDPAVSELIGNQLLALVNKGKGGVDHVHP